MSSKIIAISFARGDAAFLKGRERLNQCYEALGVDKIISYDWNDIINSDFYKENKFILDQPRGSGYWLWKPYLIWKTLKECALKENDIVWYNDSRNVISGEQLQYLREVIARDSVYIRHDPCWRRSQYTKRDAFVLMGLDTEQYWKCADIHAATLAFSAKSLPLLEEWLYWCRHPNIITDLPNICGLPNFDDFVDHRHDQAILSLLVEKYRIPIQPFEGYKRYSGEYLTQVPFTVNSGR